jgi:hypothetical protein
VDPVLSGEGPGDLLAIHVGVLHRATLADRCRAIDLHDVIEIVLRGHGLVAVPGLRGVPPVRSDGLAVAPGQVGRELVGEADEADTPALGARDPESRVAGREAPERLVHAIIAIQVDPHAWRAKDRSAALPTDLESLGGFAHLSGIPLHGARSLIGSPHDW